MWDQRSEVFSVWDFECKNENGCKVLPSLLYPLAVMIHELFDDFVLLNFSEKVRSDLRYYNNCNIVIYSPSLSIYQVWRWWFISPVYLTQGLGGRKGPSGQRGQSRNALDSRPA